MTYSLPQAAQLFTGGPDLRFVLTLVVPFAAMAFALVVTVLVTRAKTERRRLQHETIRLALEKGQPLPPSLLQDN